MSIGRRCAYLFLKAQALVLLVLGHRDAALFRFDAMLAIDPDDRYALASKAHLLAGYGDASGAMAVLRTLTLAHPSDAGAWFNLGYLLGEADLAGEAELAFQRALGIDATQDRAWYGLSLLYIRSGRFDDAVRTLQHNIRLQPMSPFGWYQLARVQIDRRNPEEAAAIIRHLRGFEPKVAAQLEREIGLHVAQTVRERERQSLEPA